MGPTAALAGNSLEQDKPGTAAVLGGLAKGDGEMAEAAR